MLWTRPRTGVCVPLMPGVVVPEAHQDDHSCVNDLTLSSHKNLAWWVVTRRTSKTHKTIKIGRWALAKDNMVVLILRHRQFTVKRELLFQQAICYLSLRWVNILHAWTVNFVVQSTSQQSPLHPSLTFTHPHHKQVVWHVWWRWVNYLTMCGCGACKWINIKFLMER